jgi:hypothetical protein
MLVRVYGSTQSARKHESLNVLLQSEADDPNQWSPENTYVKRDQGPMCNLSL